MLFRDYGRYDHAQQRFKPGHKISDNFYVRQDGTRAYYFSKEELAQCFEVSCILFEAPLCAFISAAITMITQCFEAIWPFTQASYECPYCTAITMLER